MQYMLVCYRIFKIHSTQTREYNILEKNDKQENNIFYFVSHFELEKNDIGQ